MSGPAAKKAQPIVVKRIKKAAHGHHGGAWKIAYADFVTAMMAFFLLMWLLSSASENTLKGISEYFQQPEDAQGAGLFEQVQGEHGVFLFVCGGFGFRLFVLQMCLARRCNAV